MRPDFEEIAHTGGTVTFDVRVEPDGRMKYAVGYSHMRPTPAALFAVYALPQGIAVSGLEMGGIGSPWPEPPVPGCYPVFISSDTEGMFGHQCRSCAGYWRAAHPAAICPYCGLAISDRHQSLTPAQRQYVSEYCDVLNAALASCKPGQYVIDMDVVADAAGKGGDKPAFYYAEEKQQHLFTCTACGERTDVLGTFAYCSACGTRNDLHELSQVIQRIRERINSGGAFEACLTDAVAAFDSTAGQYARQLLARIPLTPGRSTAIENARYHNLQSAADLLRSIFDVDILAGLSAEERAATIRAFHRRHVYEHKGGEADEKYIADSGDNVRLKQALHETQESCHSIASSVIKMATNLHRSFHSIFPPRPGPIDWHKRRQKT